MRYFFSQDQSGHWYLVPDEIRGEWLAWLTLDEDDERAWTPPGGARALNKHPALYTFTDVQERM